MSLRKALFCTALAIGLTTAATAPAAIITHEEVHIQYTWQEFFAAADGKEFLVQIRGNPFAMPQEAFERAVLSKLQARSVGPTTTWTSQPGETPPAKAYRLVLVFGAGSQLGSTLCADLDSIKPPPTPAPGSVNVAAAYCRSYQPMTEAYARTSASQSDDRAFESMISELMSVLFPRKPGLLLDRGGFWDD